MPTYSPMKTVNRIKLKFLHVCNSVEGILLLFRYSINITYACVYTHNIKYSKLSVTPKLRFVCLVCMQGYLGSCEKHSSSCTSKCSLFGLSSTFRYIYVLLISRDTLERDTVVYGPYKDYYA